MMVNQIRQIIILIIGLCIAALLMPVLALAQEADQSSYQTSNITTIASDTIRYIEVVDGHVLGEWRMWQESSDTLSYESERHYHFARTEKLVLDEAGLPIYLKASGKINDGIPWYERFESEADTVRWFTPRARGKMELTGPAFYAPVYPAHDLGVVARALLQQPSRKLRLLPKGEARLEPLVEQTVEAEGRVRTLRLYAIHGLDLMPRYVWLDQEGTTFADEWSVRAGWEENFEELRDVMDETLAKYRQNLAEELVPPERTRPLVIRDARLFDPETKKVLENTTIFIEGSRIVAVGIDDKIEAPAEAEVIDAEGRMVLPGLWDMHTHLIFPAEQNPMEYRGFAPLHLAAGVTTVRDMGSHVESLVSLRKKIKAGDAVGPRILPAGFIDGAEIPYDGVGVRVGTVEEARAAVDRYADLGFPQIKIYASISKELLDVIIARAKKHDMRVGGHLTDYITSSGAIKAGYDEISHLWWLLWGIPKTNQEYIAEGETWQSWHQVLAALTPDSQPVREVIDLLAERGVAVDPTIGYFVSDSTPPEFIADVVKRLPPPLERRLLHKPWSAYYYPRSPLASPAREQALTNLTELLVDLHEANIPILPGTDTWPGFGLHYELERYVQAGIPAPEVLKLATLGSARAMKLDDKLGSIATGKRADLILIDGDPTTDISDIRRVVTVIKEGRIYDPAAIYRVLGVEPCCK